MPQVWSSVRSVLLLLVTFTWSTLMGIGTESATEFCTGFGTDDFDVVKTIGIGTCSASLAFTFAAASLLVTKAYG